MAFNKITATPNNAPVNINFKASIIYKVFKIFFGSLCCLRKNKFMKNALMKKQPPIRLPSN